MSSKDNACSSEHKNCSLEHKHRSSEHKHRSSEHKHCSWGHDSSSSLSELEERITASALVVTHNLDQRYQNQLPNLSRIMTA